MSDSNDPNGGGSTPEPPPTPDSPPKIDSGGTPPPSGSSTGMEPNVAAALSYLLGFVTGIIFLLIEKENRFVRFHAWQSILVSGVFFVLNVVVNFVPLLGCVVSVVLMFGGLILWIVLMVKAYQGEKFKLPIVGDFAEKQG